MRYLSIFMLLTASYAGAISMPGNAAEKAVVFDLPVMEDSSSVLHPEFSLTYTQLRRYIPELSVYTQFNAKRFLALADKMLHMPPYSLTLVDKFHPLPRNYRPANLKTLSDKIFLVNKRDMKLVQPALESLAAMAKAATGQGIELIIASAYRSYMYQQKLYNSYIKKFGREATQMVLAQPGYSQHQLGTTVDFGDGSSNFARSPTSSWLLKNGGDYGWSLSYPMDSQEITGYMWESWHWRWIGTDAVTMQREFFDGSQQKMLEFWDRYRSFLSSVHVP